MTAAPRKKLIEVALPLARINEAAAKEKSIRHGHPSTLHLWWARRPLAACRAVLFASLVDDPDSDPDFKFDANVAASKRAKLFDLIEELVKWENSNNPRVLNAARAEIARCVASRKLELKELKPDDRVGGATVFDIKGMLAKPEAVNAFLAEHAPPVLDPFCGGGSIPLEAQRLGLRAVASDLNPVPVLITKALIEIPPKFAGRPPVNPDWQRQSPEMKARRTWTGAQGLAEDVRYYGRWMRDEAAKRIGHLYPKVKVTAEMAKKRPDLKEYVGEELTVIAWLWARTVASPNPAFQGVHVPLVRGYWLSKKAGKLTWIEPIVDRAARSFRFAVRTGTPSNEQKKAIEAGTKLGRGCRFRCLLSDEPIPEDHIKEAGKAGELGACLLAVVAEGARGRIYLAPEAVPPLSVERPSKLQGIDVPLANDPRNLWCLGYGLDTFDKLFTPRQLVALTTFSDLVREAREQVLADARATPAGIRQNFAAPRPSHDDRPLSDGGLGAVAYADAVATYLAFCLSKVAEASSTICTWSSAPKNELVVSTFRRQAIPMTWDFGEANPFADSSGSVDNVQRFVVKSIESLPAALDSLATQLDATVAIRSVQSPTISTDPPYYDNIGYADLSDFFYVWLRRSLVTIFPSLFTTLLTPKAQELIASPYRHDGSKGRAQSFFEEGLGSAFGRMREVQAADYPLTVYYAFKQSETEDDDDDEGGEEIATASTGWETMLAGLIRSGFSIHGTWPMRTERSVRSVGLGTNALASSIILVCRPRPADAPLATRKQFITALRQELPDALRNLQAGNIAPVDLAQAAIGPGMAIFTRYARVMETDGSPMSVRTALGLINQALDEVLAEQEGDFDAETRWALAWFSGFGTAEAAFGEAETLSKAKNTAVNALAEAGIVVARAGKVRLVKRDELPDDWSPVGPPGQARRLAIWTVTQHLIRALEQGGEAGAAELLRALGDVAETARELAYRLYTVSERKKWADEALAYNSLVIAWPELSKLAQAARTGDGPTQQQMF